ncbi:MAG: efflux RND transporter periplasmic adaptor subunit [Pseudomonadales bacterium]
MSERLFSPYWYRVADLKPVLSHQVKLSRHQYRGETWYLLQDRLSGRHHRFNTHAYQLIAHLDGTQTVDEIWHSLNEQLGDEAPTQDEIIQLLGNLHQGDLLTLDMSPDIAELLQRKQLRQRRQLIGKFKNPLAIRISLLDPDTFLTHWHRFVRPLFSRTFAIVGCLFIGLAGLLALKHWVELSSHTQQVALTPYNLILLWLLYPVVKGLHELGHGFAVKVYGGEVHEMGIMLLVLAPIPYVDASEASLFKDKRQRMIVSAAGILVELLLSALALFLWLNLHDGLARDLAFNIMLIGGISTLLFNGNPLLRFDGYYILADAIEFPDLGKRANNYYIYLFQHYLFGLSGINSRLHCPAKTTREHLWLASYGLGAFVFRLIILVSITLFIATKYFAIGVLLALWAITSQALMPLAKALNFLLHSPTLQHRRNRAIGITAGLVGGLLLLFMLVPLPLYTIVPGVVWLPEQAYIRAEADGFIDQLLVEEGQQVSEGTPLVVISNPSLVYQAQQLQAQQEELHIKYNQARNTDLVEADILQQEIKILTAQAERMRERIKALTVVSPGNGNLVIPDSQNLIGQFIRQGSSIGYLFGQDSVKVRAIVPQLQIALVRKKTRAIEVRMAANLSRTLTATIEREVPSGTNKLPSKALGYSGGGTIATDASDKEGLKTLEPHFQFELRLLDKDRAAQIKPLQAVGQRVYVRFDHGWEPLAWQWYRRASQALLTQLGI